MNQIKDEMFSKSCEYAIKAVLYISTQSLEGKRVKVGEIAEQTGSPVAFMAKILSILNRYNIVASQTGPVGGFYIEKENMNRIKISDIVSAIDGDNIYNGCGLGLEFCDSENPCPLHSHFSRIRNELKMMLENTSVYDLAVKVKAGDSVLLR